MFDLSLGSLIKPVKELWANRQERLAAHEKARQAVVTAKSDTENHIALSRQDLAKMRVSDMGKSKKDEVLLYWILVIFTLQPTAAILGLHDAATIIDGFISHHFPPNTIALLIGAIYGINRLFR